MIRKVALAAALAVAAPVVAVAAHASDPAPAETHVVVWHRPIDVKVGPNNDTTCRVDADFYAPFWASNFNPIPALLMTHGFGGSKDDLAGAATAYAKRGYAVLAYSGLGFGDSGCNIQLDDPDWDGKAASQLVSYIAGTHPAADGHYQRLGAIKMDGPGDPRVGMIGGSYGGQVQFAAAAVDRRIDTIVPLITWNDLSYSLAPNNVLGSTTPGVAKYQWTSFFFGVGAASTPARTLSGTNASASAGCLNFDRRACDGIAHLLATGYPAAETVDFVKHASVASYAKRVRIPTLLGQGQADSLFNLKEAADTYAALQRNGVPVKMIWHGWGHSGGSVPGEYDADGGDGYLNRVFLNWFERYLKGAKVSTGPAFEWFRPWAPYRGLADEAYGRATSFPVGGTQTLRFSGSDLLTLGKSAPGAATFSALPAPASYSETSAVEPGAFVPADAQGTFAQFVTPPLAAPAESVGIPTATLNLQTAGLPLGGDPGTDLVLFAKLYDIAPDGSVSLVRRLVSPLRISDTSKPVRIALPGQVHRYEKGHRIAFVLASSDAAYRGNNVARQVTLSAAGSSVSLPVMAPLRFAG